VSDQQILEGLRLYYTEPYFKKAYRGEAAWWVWNRPRPWLVWRVVCARLYPASERVVVNVAARQAG